MKYLLLIAVVVAVFWLMGARRRSVSTAPRERGGPASPQSIEACAHCGVHLPRAEMVAGAHGRYCSEAHRLARGDAG